MYDIINGNTSFYFLCVLLIAALFFMTLGIRKLRKKHYEGFLYLLVTLFLVMVHIFYLISIPLDNELSYLTAQMNLWYWSVLMLAPSLIFLFIFFSFMNFVMNRYNIGAFNLFFGLSLLCFLFILGSDWPLVLKGVITFGFTFLYFKTEIRVN